MFWKIPGFSQPSPVERVLDKEEFTLEELLDEDDLVQEAKSLNGRLIAFLREPSSVEQLVRYLVEPQDSDDPKRTYKYPFAACEVLCCELEAVFNTLLEEHAIMKLLFSLLDAPVPLSSKVAGYFGRVVGSLLMRKRHEMLQYFQAEGDVLLEKLVTHVDTTSVADVVKRMVGADDQNSMMPSPAMSQWLAETPLVNLLLSRLASSHSAEAQANAADILSATANAQPSPLAFKLAEQACMATLIEHALAPGRQVLVPALNVCIALLEPQRPILGDSGSVGASLSDSAQLESTTRARNEAAAAIVQQLPPLVEMLSWEGSKDSTIDCPYGVLSPRLGRSRLKIVELLAVLIRSGCAAAEEPIMQSFAVPKCLHLFAQFPFNNLLHHNVASMVQACMSSTSEAMLRHLFVDCCLLDWIVQLPQTIMPLPLAGREAQAAAKAPLRAGYLGHVTQVAAALEGIATRPPEAEADADAGGSGQLGPSKVAAYAKAHEGWLKYVEEVLHPQQELENTSRWACGRPAAPGAGGMDSDGDEFQHEFDLEQITGLHQPLYHRYSTVENEDDDDDEGAGDVKAGPFDFSADMITEGMAGMDIHGMYLTSDNQEDPYGMEDTGPVRSQPALGGRQAHDDGMDNDDDVLLATSDEEFPSDGASPEASVKTGSSISSHGLQGQTSEGGDRGPDDMVLVYDEEGNGSGGSSPEQQELLGDSPPEKSAHVVAPLPCLDASGV